MPGFNDNTIDAIPETFLQYRHCSPGGVRVISISWGEGEGALVKSSMAVVSNFWESYKTVISSKRHRAVGQETGQTNPIERLNNTVRQRISRLVLKNGKSPWGTLWYFIHDYNAQQSKGLSLHHYYRITTLPNLRCRKFLKLPLCPAML
jgi:hypothetical protein